MTLRDERLFTVTEAVRNATDTLRAAGVEGAAADARIMAAHVLGCDRVGLIGRSDQAFPDKEKQHFDELIARRAAREPVARILGEREFWGLPFGLNEATLEPRPDSETLVEAVLARLGKKKGDSLRILDLGTGTGCLLLALLHELPDATGLGVDIAPRAVEQARQNAGQLGLADRAEFRVNYWLESLGETFDIIISNPPYIPGADISSLMPEVRDYDPHAALDGGIDGLEVYRFLVLQLPYFLNPGGLAVFEVGQGQAETVSALFHAAGFTDVSVHKDLGGVERAVAGRR